MYYKKLNPSPFRILCYYHININIVVIGLKKFVMVDYNIIGSLEEVSVMTALASTESDLIVCKTVLGNWRKL